MKNKAFAALIYALFWAGVGPVLGQQLSVEKIMQDPKTWIGTSPSNVFWSDDSKAIYFFWNPENAKSDSLYSYTLADKKIRKASAEERRAVFQGGTYNLGRTLKVFSRSGDLFLADIKTGKTRQLTRTVEAETAPFFALNESKIYFQRSNNLFSLDWATGEITQWTQFLSGIKKTDPRPNEQEKWLKNDQLMLFDVLRERAEKRKEGERIAKAEQPKRPKEIYIDDKQLDGLSLSPAGRFITFRLSKSASSKATIVPSYVTESGFTEDISSRSKVGYALAFSESYLYDMQRDTVLTIDTKGLPGLDRKPDYAKPDTAQKGKKTELRRVIVNGPSWNEDGSAAVVVVRSTDNKDRWIALLDPQTGKLKNLDHQRDEAWIGGPGVGFAFGMGSVGWLDKQQFWFQSEATGYSHLYVVNVTTGQQRAVTAGKWEVQSAQLSNDKGYFYLTTNEKHPGEQHFYQLNPNLAGYPRQALTSAEGAHQVVLSPDERYLATLYSTANKPWELFLQENTPQAKPQKITNSVTGDFKNYSWKTPEVLTIPASDGAQVYARLYRPSKKNGAAVVFVHGAGYLQNAHKWWSSYFREYQFHHLLNEIGYTVLDIDYRASAGYGRDWRTGIYRFMGGKDLEDHVDAARWLVQKEGIDPQRIGIYGGSYGGFITLMAMFTKPGVFAAGAALRPVTDWAAYNHGYTSNILNEPFTDSTSYRRSSPIYHASGLKGALLICHGLVDVNVHPQDSFRLAQRLMELRKENWELAIYPVEDHGFVEPTSWMDEYKRILKLFEAQLGPRKP
jgi:dipeptidyl aminopeptidase/acylaminoacyl peptidase